MSEGEPKLIVIGCGKQGAGDHGAALEVIIRLRAMPDLGCELRTCEEGCPPGFLAEIPPDTLVIFIDALQTSTEAGTIHCLRLPSTLAHPRHLESGSYNLRQEIDLARERNGRVPRMCLLGIEVTNNMSGSELSEKVRKAVDEIVLNFPRYRKLAQGLA